MKLDEFTIGQVFQTKSFELTKENIKNFAEVYDPQYMHLNEEKAKMGRFNGIIASGIQTLSITFKLWIEEGCHEDDIIAGTGMNNIKFLAPVYPNDKLNTIVKVIDKNQIKARRGYLLYCYLPIIRKRKKCLKVSYQY